MPPEPREPEVVENIARLTMFPQWQNLKDEANKRLERYEGSISRLLFKTRSEVDPTEIEFYRGFRQGVFYVLEGLPNEILAELKRSNEETQKEVG